jgi:hypothetical protein
MRKDCQKSVEALFARFSRAQSRIFPCSLYSVFKEQPPDTLLPAARCETLPFVRFSVKGKLARFVEKGRSTLRARLLSRRHLPSVTLSEAPPPCRFREFSPKSRLADS